MDATRITYYFNKYKYQVEGYVVKIFEGYGLSTTGCHYDIASDCFVALLTVDDLGDLTTRRFVFKKALRDSLNIIKHENRVKKHHSIILESLEEYVEAQDVKSELVTLIAAEINRLPIAQRLVFKMRYIDDMSRAEVCKILKIQLGTFDTHMMRAKQRIRSVFKDREV